MGNLTTISAQVKTILTAIQANGANAFVEVVEFPTNEFSGYPAASITPAQIVSQYLTVAQNQRGYGYMIELYRQINIETDWSVAFTQMRDLVDAVLDALDQSIDLNGKCDFLAAVPMEWTLQEAGQGKVLAAAIHIVATKVIDVR